MAATVQDKTILEYGVHIKLDNRQTPVYVWVDRNSGNGSWRLHLASNDEFFIKELIDICTAVYEAGIFEDGDTYILESDSWTDYFYIRGKDRVVDSILEQIKIPFPKKEAES